MIINILFYAGLIVFGLLQLLDIFSTVAFLDRGKGEANPAVRAMLEVFNDLWFIPKGAIAVAIIWLLHTTGPSPTSLVTVWILNAAYTYAVWVNGRAAGWWR